MKQSRHLFLNYSFPGRSGRRNQRRATNWRKVGGRTRKTFYSIRRRNIEYSMRPVFISRDNFLFFLFFLERSKANLEILFVSANKRIQRRSLDRPSSPNTSSRVIHLPMNRWFTYTRQIVKLFVCPFDDVRWRRERSVCEENKAKRKCACRYFAWIDECDRWRGKEKKKKKKEKRNVGRIRANLGNMGSSNKARKHYKKDSRFVTDLYTFTYDDFDLVRFKCNVNTTEWRVSPFHLIERLITFTK